MEGTAGTSVTMTLERNVEKSAYEILTQGSTEVLSETNEEGCEPNDHHYTSYSDGGKESGPVYDDTGLCGISTGKGGLESDDADARDGYHEDEENAYDENEAYKSSYEHEAAESEEEDEESEKIDEEDAVPLHPITSFSDYSGHEAYGSGEIAHASSKSGSEGSDVDWSTAGIDPERSYVYEECSYFRSSLADVQYAFQRHMINVFEASFHRFGHHHFAEELKSKEWRQKILTDDGVGRLAKLSWDTVHGVELKDWIKFLKRVNDAGLLPKDALADPETFSPPNLNPAFHILGMAKYIRNKTFHRDEPVIESQLRTALQIPRVLKDRKSAEELEAIYGVICDNPTLDAPSSQSVRDILFPPQPEHGTCLEVDAQILRMLEEGCFYFAQREDPRLLLEKFWTEPEHGEMQRYAKHWQTPPCEHRDLAKALKPEECANLDGQFFLHQHLREAVMGLATDSRNSVSHRNLVNERSVCYSAWNSILCLLLMDDRIRAIKIESLTEAFLTKMSQKDVLVRLHDASWCDEPARRHAIVETCRQEGVEADHLDSPERKSFPVLPQPQPDTKSRWFEMSQSAKAKQSLTDEEKMELWHSAVQRFVFSDSMHETLMRERSVE